MPYKDNPFLYDNFLENYYVFFEPWSQRQSMSCAKCGYPVHGSSCIACTSCSRWTHAKKVCSNPSSVDAKREAIINSFRCSHCSAETAIGTDQMDSVDSSPQLKSVLNLMLRELQECKERISQLRDDCLHLRKENSDIKSALGRLQNTKTPKNAPPSSITVSPSRRHS